VTERRQWLLAVVVAVLAILLGRGLLLAFNDFFFVDRGLELPPTEPPSQVVTPLLALAFHRLDHYITRSLIVSIPVPPACRTAGLLATAGHSPQPGRKG
jgi:hypothetical protein